MKCLFIFSNMPLSENYGGSASRYLSAYLAMLKLGISVDVLRLLERNWQTRIQELEIKMAPEQLQQYELASNWLDVVYDRDLKATSLSLPLFYALYNPLLYTFPEIKNLAPKIIDTIDKSKPDFIFAQMYPAGAVLAHISPKTPWIFGHHDWQYKEQAIRMQSSKTSFRTRARNAFTSMIRKKAEEYVSTSAFRVAAASPTEAKELQNIGAKQVNVVQTSYQSVRMAPAGKSILNSPRITHLGHLGNVANSTGLLRFLEIVYPRISHLGDFQIIGDSNQVNPKLQRMLRHLNISPLGHIQNLADAVRPFDIAVIPYEYNTGVRTKIPLLFNYAQVVIATRIAVEGHPYLEHGNNCYIVDNLNDFANAITELISDSALRIKLGVAAKNTFEANFTLDGVIQDYINLLQGINPTAQSIFAELS